VEKITLRIFNYILVQTYAGTYAGLTPSL